MLNIPVGSAVNLSEFVCGSCSNEFWVSYDPREKFICPFCGEESYNNGGVMVYVKKEISE